MSQPLIYALDFSPWKRRSLGLCFPNHQLCFISHLDRVPEGAIVAVWGMRTIPDAQARALVVARIEDGFLRSVGLGADLIPPLSWVVDWSGIYFDATHPSDLEVLLSQTIFSDELRQRAALLQARIVESGFTKYNVGATSWRRPLQTRRLILVPGQVESDASITYGAPGIKSNMELLQAVRAANPDAYLLYKPHPDVVAGLRVKGRGEHDAARWCDAVVLDVPMGELLCAVDEVHCLTSLAGFEALLRGKAVTCYGQPFYAGWGLTTDVLPISRRSRRLSLDELVAGVLILYPRYMNRKQDALITPEEALDELEVWQAQMGRTTPWYRKAFRLALRRVVGVR